MVGDGNHPAVGSSQRNPLNAHQVRGGVPVFKRPTGKFNSRKRCASEIEGGSPARPPLRFLQTNVDDTT